MGEGRVMSGGPLSIFQVAGRAMSAQLVGKVAGARAKLEASKSQEDGADQR